MRATGAQSGALCALKHGTVKITSDYTSVMSTRTPGGVFFCCFMFEQTRIDIARAHCMATDAASNTRTKTDVWYRVSAFITALIEHLPGVVRQEIRIELQAILTWNDKAGSFPLEYLR